MNQENALAELGGILADRSRSTMLLALMDGRAYTASELARTAGIAPQTASHHLERLERAGMLARLRQGRHSYFRIADERVAGFIEQALGAQHALNVSTVRSNCPASLRHARSCYDHLAGTVGVHLLRAGLQRGVFRAVEDRYEAGENAEYLLDMLGIDAPALHGRACLDWSERRFHLAGPLAAAILRQMLELRWLLSGDGRQLVVTEKGRRDLRRMFGDIEPEIAERHDTA